MNCIKKNSWAGEKGGGGKQIAKKKNVKKITIILQFHSPLEYNRCCSVVSSLRNDLGTTLQQKSIRTCFVSVFVDLRMKIKRLQYLLAILEVLLSLLPDIADAYIIYVHLSHAFPE